MKRCPLAELRVWTLIPMFARGTDVFAWPRQWICGPAGTRWYAAADDLTAWAHRSGSGSGHRSRGSRGPQGGGRAREQPSRRARAVEWRLVPVRIASVAGVELVLDLADELLNDVFESNEARDLPLLVEHEREVSLLPAHIAQDCIDPGLFGDVR